MADNYPSSSSDDEVVDRVADFVRDAFIGTAGLSRWHYDVKYGFDVNAYYTGNFRERSNALLEASRCGCLRNVEWLLDHGANTDVMIKERMTPLMLALRNGHWETADALLQRGAAAGSVHYANLEVFSSTEALVCEPAIFYALGRSLGAVELLAKHGIVPPASNQEHVFKTSGQTISLLSVVTDCEGQDGDYRPRPEPSEVMPLMRLASRHVTAAQHYALCDAPLVCNATLDGAIVYLTGAAAGKVGRKADVRVLCVPNSLLLGERSPSVAKVLAGKAPDPGKELALSASAFPRWLGQYPQLRQVMLPAVMVAVWGSRCPAMRFVALCCGALYVRADVADVPFPTTQAAALATSAASANAAPGASADKGAIGGLTANALLAAVASCQLSERRMRKQIFASPAAVRMLAACAAGVALFTVRQLRAAAVSTQGVADSQAARDTLAFCLGDTFEQPGAEDGQRTPRLRRLPAVTHIMSLDDACDLLHDTRRQVTKLPEEFRYSDSSIGHMSHEDMGALLGFATWRLRRGLVLRREQDVGNVPQELWPVAGSQQG